MYRPILLVTGIIVRDLPHNHELWLRDRDRCFQTQNLNVAVASLRGGGRRLKSADNARGFTQARFMLAGYESESVAPELVSVFPLITESCERSDGTAGFRKGPAIDNQSPYNIEVRAESVLNAAGETLSWTYEAGELTLAPGQYSPAICRPVDDTSPYGSDYVESWFTYYDPTSDKLIESSICYGMTITVALMPR